MSMISKETIIDFFKDLIEGSDFNIDEKLLWSYFFLDENEKKLQEFGVKLGQLVYVSVSLTP